MRGWLIARREPGEEKVEECSCSVFWPVQHFDKTGKNEVMVYWHSACWNAKTTG